MSLRKRFLFAMLFTIVAMATDGRGSVYGAEYDVPTSFLPIQFKNLQLKNPGMGVGKILVASRNLGDPSFAGTVILLVQYDGKGVVGLVLNRRTDVPLSRVLDLEGRERPVRPGLSRGTCGTHGRVGIV